MNLTIEQVSKINKVQLEIFKSFIGICQKLNLKYYLTHGSLLGAVRYKGFFPGDDDIDVLMPRDDYERLIKFGPALIPNHYFIQSSKSDGYPLPMIKIRDSRTTYIIENVRELNVNHGVYIDIFPLDYTPQFGRIKKRLFYAILKILNFRISSLYKQTYTPFRKIISLCSKIILPSINFSIHLREKLYTSVSATGFYSVYGGKIVERQMPVSWFGGGSPMDFEGIKVTVPCKYEEYLKLIYGDFETYSPVAKLMVGPNLVKMNACIIDLEKPYTYFITSKKDL